MAAGPSLCLRSAHSCWSSEAADHQPVLTSAPSWTRWWQCFCLGWILRGGSGGGVRPSRAAEDGKEKTLLPTSVEMGLMLF